MRVGGDRLRAAATRSLAMSVEVLCKLFEACRLVLVGPRAQFNRASPFARRPRYSAPRNPACRRLGPWRRGLAPLFAGGASCACCVAERLSTKSVSARAGKAGVAHRPQRLHQRGEPIRRRRRERAAATGVDGLGRLHDRILQFLQRRALVGGKLERFLDRSIAASRLSTSASPQARCRPARRRRSLRDAQRTALRERAGDGIGDDVEAAVA